MYLTEEIEGKETVGFLKGKSFMTDKLQNFGYASIEVTSQNPMLAKGTIISCHEFHKSNVSIDEDKIYTLTKEVYDGSKKQWSCGYMKNNTLAAYGHIHFFGNMNMFNDLLSKS